MSQQINLFNEGESKSGIKFSLQNMLQGMGAILLCAMLFYAYLAHQSSLLVQQLEEANKGLLAEQNKLANLNADISRQHAGLTLEQEIKKLSDELIAQREIINTLKSGVIGNTQGYSQYMLAYARQIVSGLWLTGFSIEGDATQMSISGAALTPELVPGFIMRLNHETVMRGKTFTALQMQLPKVEAAKTSAQYLEFTLQSVVAIAADNK